MKYVIGCTLSPFFITSDSLSCLKRLFLSVFHEETIKLGEYSWTFLVDAIFDVALLLRYQEIMIFLLTIRFSMTKEVKFFFFQDCCLARFGQGERYSEIQVEFFNINIFCITGLGIISLCRAFS